MNTALSGVVYIQAISFVFTMFMLIFACRNQEESNMPTLNPIESYKIDIPETSDLCFGSTKDILYTVSDNTGKAYKINTKGNILSELQYTGSDLEGICFVDNQFIYVAEERLRKIIKLNLQGSLIEQKTISVENNAENEGLEGISYATFNQHFYIVNEMNPKVLIETDKNLNVLHEYPLTFADDFSGICVDNTNQELWIVSDLSSTATKCTMTGESIKSYRIPVYNAEGIAYQANDSVLYIVSDSQSKLYKFKVSN
jgi:uncharacterized protein YjiK